jgi:leucyl-tRNA synthetase
VGEVVLDVAEPNFYHKIPPFSPGLLKTAPLPSISPLTWILQALAITDIGTFSLYKLITPDHFPFSIPSFSPSILPSSLLVGENPISFTGLPTNADIFFYFWNHFPQIITKSKMSAYDFQEVEKKWQEKWESQGLFTAKVDPNRPKFYSLDMFPYPSGAGLHVGHPLGYIASDIVTRFKRLKGFNVLHPMGYDSFGLPAEQYAIQTGQHPAVTTEENIQRYTEQLKRIGFAFDWDKEVRTSDPYYYKWTQWIFMQLFDSYYDQGADKARPIAELEDTFHTKGNQGVNVACDEDIEPFSAEEWKGFSAHKKQEILLKYRLTYLAETTVNWCPALGTVLSNDEVKEGFSERGGHPVERKKMMQWNMRITAYAERLLNDLEEVEWPEPVKEMQRNWIGRSTGAEMVFQVEAHDLKIKVFTTRIDTIYGVTYLALAPEHEFVEELITEEHRNEVESYVATAKNRSERDRMSDVKTISGAFTGAYAINPFNQERIPIWVADYVLAGYGTGAVMAVPAHDERDYNFARHFGLEIRQVIEGNMEEGSFPGKDGMIMNSGLISGLPMQAAMDKAIAFLEENKLERVKSNTRCGMPYSPGNVIGENPCLYILKRVSPT